MVKSYSPEERALLSQIGERIRELRRKVNLSQEKLAFAASLDRTYIGSVERGERNISVINLHKIASALQVPASELLKDI